jgi:hypothetical protein
MCRRRALPQIVSLVVTRLIAPLTDGNVPCEPCRRLAGALNAKGWEYGVDEGGGAFYGPKIDIKIRDAIGTFSQTQGPSPPLHECPGTLDASHMTAATLEQ